MAAILDSELNRYWPLLTMVQKQSILSVIKLIVTTPEEIIPELGVTIEQYNKEIDEAVARMEAGEFTSHEDVVKMLEQW